MDPLITLARSARRPTRVDAAVTGVLLVWAVAEALVFSNGVAGVAFAVAVSAPLLLRRQAPLAVHGWLVLALLARATLVPGPQEGTFPFPSLIVSTFSLGLYVPALVPSAAGGAATVAVMLALFPLGFYDGPPDIGQVAILCFFVAGAWTAGRLLRVRALALADERSQSTALAERAVAEERARIARELHDVVAHSLSIIAVQSGAAEELVAVDPDRARTHMGAARRTAREALAEMRHVVGVLRDGGDAPAAAFAPQPTLERLPELADEVRAAGLDVTLVVDGDRGSVPAGVDLAGYRIVQEALTNVRRHAPGVAVTARVAYTARSIDIEVRNARTAPGAPAAPADPGGRGLVGMRERAHLYGGTFHVDLDGDAFRVRVTLPREDM